MENPDPFKLPPIELNPELDIALFFARVRAVTQTFKKRFSKEDPKIIDLAVALFYTYSFSRFSKELEKEMSRLSAESKTLLESLGAHTPERKIKMEILAKKIQAILAEQRKFDLNTVTLNRASPNEIMKAKSLVSPLVSELDEIENPKVHLN